MHYVTAPYWCVGNRMEVNQDSLVIQQVMTARGRVLLVAVCDGMGGMDYGQEASGYVTRRIQEWFYEGLMYYIRRKRPFWAIRRSFERLVYDIQQKMIEYCVGQNIRLGTTMTVLVLWESRYMLWHLGDSRAYLFKSGARCLTKDHAVQGNRLTKCVGGFGHFVPDYRLGKVKIGNCFLLCSDGFWRCANDCELYEALMTEQTKREEGAVKVLTELGKACMKRGEKDNLSAIFVRIER